MALSRVFVFVLIAPLAFRLTPEQQTVCFAANVGHLDRLLGRLCDARVPGPRTQAIGLGPVATKQVATPTATLVTN